jgi:hypothetical protein
MADDWVTWHEEMCNYHTFSDEEKIAYQLRRLDDFAKLGQNWDSYDGDPITPEAIASGRYLVHKLYEMLKQVGWVVPICTGGVMIGFALNDIEDFAIEVGTSGDSYGYLLCPTVDSHSWVEDDGLTWDQITVVVRQFKQLLDDKRFEETEKRCSAMRGVEVNEAHAKMIKEGMMGSGWTRPGL